MRDGLQQFQLRSKQAWCWRHNKWQIPWVTMINKDASPTKRTAVKTLVCKVIILQPSSLHSLESRSGHATEPQKDWRPDHGHQLATDGTFVNLITSFYYLVGRVAIHWTFRLAHYEKVVLLLHTGEAKNILKLGEYIAAFSCLFIPRFNCKCLITPICCLEHSDQNWRSETPHQQAT